MTNAEKCIKAIKKHGAMSLTGIEKTGLISRMAANHAILGSRRKHGTDEFIIVGYEARDRSGQHSDQKVYGLGPGVDFDSVMSMPERQRMADRSLSPFERIFGKG